MKYIFSVLLMFSTFYAINLNAQVLVSNDDAVKLLKKNGIKVGLFGRISEKDQNKCAEVVNENPCICKFAVMMSCRACEDSACNTVTEKEKEKSEE